MFLLLAGTTMSQPLYEHRGVQFATHGTDFWFSVPRTKNGLSFDHVGLYVVAEHDCRVTVSNDLIDFVYVKDITNCYEINSRLDTLNFIELPKNIIFCEDHLYENLPVGSAQPGYGPQPRAFHLTSTDTICAYIYSYSFGNIDVTNLLPTEMLRDEYILQTFPNYGVSDTNNNIGGLNMGCFQVVATEDSTVVDIVLGGRDWMDRTPDSVITLVLDRGMMFYDQVGDWCHEYHDCCVPSDPLPPACDTSIKTTVAYRFPIDPTIDTFVYANDLSGTYVKARDNKRIAVFQGNQKAVVGDVAYSDLAFEQALPIRYAGTEFLIPNLIASKEDYILFTGIVDGTSVTITNPASTPMETHTFNLDARQTYRFVMDSIEGPFYITTTHPTFVSVMPCSLVLNYLGTGHLRGDPAVLVVLPVEWWHNGKTLGTPVYWIDENNNGYSYYHSVHLFTRTTDVAGMYFNRYPIDTLFHPVAGTPYSYAIIYYNSPLNIRGTHLVENRLGGTYWVVADAEDLGEHAVYSYSHKQPGKNYLEVNDMPADQWSEDSIWCMYDPIRFHGWVERPADSIIWDFGDGNVERYRYEDGQWVTHTYADTGRFEVRRIIQYMDEALDTNWGYVACKSVFTLPSDTMYAHIWIHNHYDSAFSVMQCEGAFTFRGHVLETTDTHYVTTYWTESGCDTLWQIDLVTCPHCSFYSDTISDEQLPWVFHGVSFAHETKHYPVYIDIGEECDSIIDYYLIVIPHWGEPPLDTIFVLAPNVITPGSDIEVNRRFKLFCSKDIEAAEVYIFDRMGRRLAHFDGLTEEWDGTFKGKPCPQGAYAYKVRYIDGSNRNWKTIAGTFTIIR